MRPPGREGMCAGAATLVSSRRPCARLAPGRIVVPVIGTAAFLRAFREREPDFCQRSTLRMVDEADRPAVGEHQQLHEAEAEA